MAGCQALRARGGRCRRSATRDPDVLTMKSLFGMGAFANDWVCGKPPAVDGTRWMCLTYTICRRQRALAVNFISRREGAAATCLSTDRDEVEGEGRMERAQARRPKRRSGARSTSALMKTWKFSAVEMAQHGMTMLPNLLNQIRTIQEIAV